MIAKKECEVRNWGWLEPVEVSGNWGKWVIRTNYGSRGVNALLIVRKRDGKIIKAAYLSR